MTSETVPAIAPEAASKPSVEVREDLRLALVLNGGTSLAVWMGGVVDQIDALRCAGFTAGQGEDADPTLAIYSRLLAALRLRVQIDVISGTSAGGINGALLATAIQRSGG
jgi:predicted acylesterase/phospholipase RssA